MNHHEGKNPTILRPNYWKAIFAKEKNEPSWNQKNNFLSNEVELGYIEFLFD